MATRPLHVVLPLVGTRDELMAAFHDDPATWLPPPGRPSAGGHLVRLATGSLLPGPPVALQIVVGPVVQASGDLAVRALSWRAVRLAAAFPTLDADLELDVRRQRRLRLVGGYTPPLAVVGDVADRVVGRHVANELARSFLSAIARRLVASAERAGEEDGTRPRPSGQDLGHG